MRTFKEILYETIYHTEKHPNEIMKKLANRGYVQIITPPDSDKLLPDVHGIPSGYSTYGRGGVYKDNTLFLEGGPQGSSSGHPSDIHTGFYWGSFVDKSGKGYVVIRGRADTSPKDIARMEVPIVKEILKRIPKI
ncbi:MAG: hypothetical protein LBD41_03125 [Clostridiales Family XIII bacterium]|jgi:hypothetical protein|nr:hypothetical protein [Clostridiales Family XIII bacterium]